MSNKPNLNGGNSPLQKLFEPGFELTPTQENTLYVATMVLATAYGLNHFQQPPLEAGITSIFYAGLVEVERRASKFVGDLFLPKKRAGLILGFTLFGASLCLPGTSHPTKRAAEKAEQVVTAPFKWVMDKLGHF